MLLIFLILTLKDLNNVLFNYIQHNPVFTSIISDFCHNALIHEFKFSNGRFYDHFLSYSLKLINSNGIRTLNHLVCKRTLNHLAKCDMIITYSLKLILPKL